MAGVSQTNRSNTADADGVATVFNFTFFVYSTDDIKVYSVLDDVLTPITTGITKAINSSFIGGTVTFAVAPADAVGDILIRREVPYTQETEFADITRYKETAIEEALNTLVLQIQQLAEESELGLKYNETASITDVTIEEPVADAVLVFSGTTGRVKAGQTTASLDTLAGITSEIVIVAGIAAAVSAVAAIDSDVTTVAGMSANIAAVVANATNINTVAGISADVTTVAGISANVTTVAGISANVTTVAGISASVTTVAGVSAAVSTVATDISNVNTCATNIANINTVAGIAADGDITAVAGLSGTGLATRTAANTWTTRTLTAGVGIAVTNGDGVLGNPTVSNPDLPLRCTTTLSKTNNTLTLVSGMTKTLEAGGLYTIEGILETTSGTTGGIKCALVGDGTLAVANMNIGSFAIQAGAIVSAGCGRVTALGSNLAAGAGAGITATDVYFKGSFFVSTGGVIEMQAAQNVTNATPSTFLVSSFMRITKVN